MNNITIMEKQKKSSMRTKLTLMIVFFVVGVTVSPFLVRYTKDMEYFPIIYWGLSILLQIIVLAYSIGKYKKLVEKKDDYPIRAFTINAFMLYVTMVNFI